MRVEEIKWLLGKLNVEKIFVSPDGEKVKSSCPLAPWRHPSGRDNHPSFVVFAYESKHSRAHCSSCQYNGFLTQLVQAVEYDSKKKLPDLVNYIATHELDVETQKKES